MPNKIQVPKTDDVLEIDIFITLVFSIKRSQLYSFKRFYYNIIHFEEFVQIKLLTVFSLVGTR